MFLVRARAQDESIASSDKYNTLVWPVWCLLACWCDSSWGAHVSVWVEIVMNIINVYAIIMFGAVGKMCSAPMCARWGSWLGGQEQYMFGQYGWHYFNLMNSTLSAPRFMAIIAAGWVDRRSQTRCPFARTSQPACCVWCIIRRAKYTNSYTGCSVE